MHNLDKCLATWTHIIGHDNKGLSKGFQELIIATIQNLEELKRLKDAD